VSAAPCVARDSRSRALWRERDNIAWSAIAIHAPSNSPEAKHNLKPPSQHPDQRFAPSHADERAVHGGG
jgi:hypothetical protein